MFDDLDDNSDWFTLVQRRIRAARNERDLKECSALLDAHQFLALPEQCQRDLTNQYADKLSEMGVD